MFGRLDQRTEMFLALVRPHMQRLYALARQYTRSPDDAGDLLQETMLRAWRNYAPTQGADYCRAWLVTIQRNIAAEWHRARERRVRLVPVETEELTDLVGIDPAEPFPALSPMSEQQFREFLDATLVAAMDALPVEYREVIVLSVAGDLSYREIAEVLDCPVGTVMSRMGRARRALREQLADHARRPDGLRCGGST